MSEVLEENKPKHQSGRPLSELNLPEDWKQKILAEYEDGASDSEIKGMIYKWRGSFSNDLWLRWLAEEPEFSETIRAGRLLAEQWWTRQGRKNLHSKETFLPNLWFMNMKNRFGWADRQEVKSENTNLNVNSEASKLKDLTDEELNTLLLLKQKLEGE